MGDEEKKIFFRKLPVPDLTAYLMNTSFTKFMLPEKAEGFDDLRYEWSKGTKCNDYLKQWVLDKKITMRIEDLTPGSWFHKKNADYQRVVQTWHAKQNEHKAKVARKIALAAEKARKEAEKKAKEEEDAKAKEQAEKQAEDAKMDEEK